MKACKFEKFWGGERGKKSRHVERRAMLVTGGMDKGVGPIFF